jgi:hypothetical protein
MGIPAYLIADAPDFRPAMSENDQNASKFPLDFP